MSATPSRDSQGIEDRLKAELRQYFATYTADVTKTIVVPVWRGSNREKRLLERLGLLEAAESHHREIERRKYDAVIVTKASGNSVSSARRSSRPASGTSHEGRGERSRRLRPDDPLAALQSASLPNEAVEVQPAPPAAVPREAHILPILPLATPPAQSKQESTLIAVATPEPELLIVDASSAGPGQAATPPQGQLIEQQGRAAGPIQMLPVPLHRHSASAQEVELPFQRNGKTRPEGTLSQLVVDHTHQESGRPSLEERHDGAGDGSAEKSEIGALPDSLGGEARLPQSGLALSGEIDSGVHDPFATTFPTSLIAVTTEEIEPDEWDNFQEPESEPEAQELTPEAQELTEAITEGDTIENVHDDDELPDLMFMLSSTLIVPKTELGVSSSK